MAVVRSWGRSAKSVAAATRDDAGYGVCALAGALPAGAATRRPVSSSSCAR